MCLENQYHTFFKRMKCLLHNISAYYIQFSTLMYEVRGPVMSILSIRQYYKYWIRYVIQWRDIHTGIGVTWRCKGNQLPPPTLQYLFYTRIIFLWILNWRGANINCVQSEGKECMDMNPHSANMENMVSSNIASRWQMGFNSEFKGLRAGSNQPPPPLLLDCFVYWSS
jgi:hypothetical protein